MTKLSTMAMIRKFSFRLEAVNRGLNLPPVQSLTCSFSSMLILLAAIYSQLLFSHFIFQLTATSVSNVKVFFDLTSVF